MEYSKKLARKWLQNADNLAIGEELLLPARNKIEVKEKLKIFAIELQALTAVDIKAMELQLTTKFKDNRFWLVIKKVAFSPLIAFKRKANGEVERVLIKDTTEEKRRLFLMHQDGYID